MRERCLTVWKTNENMTLYTEGVRRSLRRFNLSLYACRLCPLISTRYKTGTIKLRSSSNCNYGGLTVQHLLYSSIIRHEIRSSRLEDVYWEHCSGRHPNVDSRVRKFSLKYRSSQNIINNVIKKCNKQCDLVKARGNVESNRIFRIVGITYWLVPIYSFYQYNTVIIARVLIWYETHHQSILPVSRD